MTTLLMLPPQTATTRAVGRARRAALPELTVVVAEDEAQAAREIGRAEAAFGTPTPALLRQAGGSGGSRPRRLRRPPATITTS